MQTLIVYRDEYQRLVRCYELHVGDRRSAEWDAIFSCNPQKEAWPCHDIGYSDRDDREYAHNRYRLLRTLVGIVLGDRPDGGRFFLDETGLYAKTKLAELYQIANFDWRAGRSG